MKPNNKFTKGVKTTWCPGCGNFGIQNALKEALEEKGLDPSDVLLISGIGQAAKMPHFINSHGLNGLHGRALPMALGARVANKALKIIVVSGDGDTYGEGGNHFIHNIRRNLDIVHIVHDNQIYGLTKGQASPTTAMGQKTTLQTDGVINEPLSPLALAISLDASFVARSFSGDQKHLKKMILAALDHKGYALIDVFQPCVTFNKVNTNDWYKERAYLLDDAYDPSNRISAFEKSLEFGDVGIPLGILYRKVKPCYIDKIKHIDGPLVAYSKKASDIKSIIETLK